MIKVMVFDLGGVIVNVKNESETPLYSLFTNNPGGNKTKSPTIFGLLKDFETGRISVEEFFEKVKKLSNLKISLDAFKRSLNNMIGPGDESIAEIVRDLSGKYVTALFSNTNEVHFRYIESHFPIVKSFSHTILSYEIGAVKPDKEAYEKLLSITGYRAEDHLFIDDRIENISAASELGIEVILFKSVLRLKRELSARGIIQHSNPI